MKLKNKKKEEYYTMTMTSPDSSEIPDQLPNIEISLEDMLANPEVIIDGTTYVWVDGYKGTNEDMQAYGSYQYELGKPYLHQGKPEICESGFHFCVKLEDVFNFYKTVFSDRYFKVRALVNKEEYNSYGTSKNRKHYISYSLGNPRYSSVYYEEGRDNIGQYYIETVTVNKLSAKVIILTEEITKENYFDYPTFVDFLSKYWVESKEELLSINGNDIKNALPKFLNNKFIMKALKYYTPEFSKLFIEKYGNWENISERAKQLSHFIRVMETCYKDGLSKDLTTTILLDSKL